MLTKTDLAKGTLYNVKKEEIQGLQLRKYWNSTKLSSGELTMLQLP